MEDLRSTIAFWLLLLQSLYFLLAGVWPLISLQSFLRVTGPKTDLWLVQAVGILVTVIGASLFVAAMRVNLVPEVLILAIGSALALAAVDIIFVARGRISRVYLVDAALELILFVVWQAVLLTTFSARS